MTFQTRISLTCHLISILLFLHLPEIARSSLVDVAESKYISEFAKFKRAISIDKITLGKLIFSNQVPSSVDQQGYNIIINRAEIAEYLNIDDSLTKALFVKFVLSHEIAHLIQMSQWGITNPSKINLNCLPFLECEADIISGYLIKEVILKVEIPDQSRNYRFNPIYFELQYTERIPELYGSILRFRSFHSLYRTHLANDDRVTALREGLIYGEFANNEHLLIKPSTHKMNSVEDNQAATIIMQLFGGHNTIVPATTEKYAWAARKALLITHGDQVAARNLVVFNQVLNWDTSRAHPNVDFSFEVYNLSRRPIDFCGMAALKYVLRNDSENMTRRLYIDDTSYQTEIPPGKSVTFRGRLKLTNGNRKYQSDFVVGDVRKFMPMLSIPGSRGSFYWTFDPKDLSFGREHLETFDTHFEAGNSFDEGEISDLIFSVLPLRSHFFQCAHGMGQSQATKKDSLFYGPIKFESIFNNEGMIYQVDQFRPLEYGVNVFSCRSKQEAESSLERLISILERVFPKWRHSEIKDGGTGRYMEFSDGSGKVFYVQSQFYADNSVFYVTVCIIGFTFLSYYCNCIS